MSERETDPADTAPGDEAAEGEEFAGGTASYAVGLGIAALLTVAAFAVVNLPIVWRPAIPMALIVFAIAQMGVHLVFFLHVSSGPDNTNNALALAFGTLVVLLLIGGSVWILGHLDHAMMPMGRQMHGFP